MEELYQRFLEGEDSHVAQEDDPFWDPVEVIHLGSAHVWLQSLAYSMKFEEQVEFMNCDGEVAAVVHIHVTPCSPEGRWVSPPSPPLPRPPAWSWQKTPSKPEFSWTRWSAWCPPKSSCSHDLASLDLICARVAKLAGLEDLRSCR